MHKTNSKCSQKYQMMNPKHKMTCEGSTFIRPQTNRTMFCLGENAAERVLDSKPCRTCGGEACKSSTHISPVDLLAESARLDEALSRAESAARRELFYLLDNAENGEVTSSSALNDQQSILSTCRDHFPPLPAGNNALYAISLCFFIGIFFLFPIRLDIILAACRYFKLWH